MSFRFSTAGESHGPGLVAIVEGLPAGLELDREALDRDMARRQLGHGRGGRMKIERDSVEVRAGIRHGRTLGSPIAVLVANRDYANWEERMNPWPVEAEVEEVHLPRPGHADLVGMQKFGHSDVRNVLERASARETAARVAAGALARAFLARARGQRSQPRDPDRLRAGAGAGVAVARGLRRRRRRSGSLPRRRGERGDGGRGRSPAQGQREPRRQLRGTGLRSRCRASARTSPGRSASTAGSRRPSPRSSRSRASRSAKPGMSPGARARRPTTRSFTRPTAASFASPTTPEVSRAG